MFFIKLREVRKKSAETRIYLHEKGYAIMKNRTVGDYLSSSFFGTSW